MEITTFESLQSGDKVSLKGSNSIWTFARKEGGFYLFTSDDNDEKFYAYPHETFLFEKMPAQLNEGVRFGCLMI